MDETEREIASLLNKIEHEITRIEGETQRDYERAASAAWLLAIMVAAAIVVFALTP